MQFEIVLRDTQGGLLGYHGTDKAVQWIYADDQAEAEQAAVEIAREDGGLAVVSVTPRDPLGDEGQDRDSYADDQDRDSYSVWRD